MERSCSTRACATRSVRSAPAKPPSFPAPTLADDAAYAVEAAALTEAYAVRAQRQLDGIEQRLLSARGAVTQIVGIVLVRNEDVFVERAVRNVAAFLRPHPRRRPRLDRPHLGHPAQRSRASSTTWTCGDRATRRARTACLRRTQAPIPGFSASTATSSTIRRGWRACGADLLEGAHADVFRMKAHVLNCDELDVDRGRASGWLAPPSRPVTKLFNFAVLDSWTESPDPLQAGNAVFKPGQHWESRRDLADSTTWETDPLRLLHLCFLPRSSVDSADRARESRRVARVRPRTGRDAEASRPPAAARRRRRTGSGSGMPAANA